MATRVIELESSVTEQLPAQGFDIESIVQKPTWKQMLLELIDSKKIDPWNVDIVEIADGFLKNIREMKNLELLIPANVILAASILLRYKSEYLKFYEEKAPDAYEVNEAPMHIIEDIPELNLTARLPPKRQITLNELLEEMEKIIKYENNERVIKTKGGIEGTINIQLDEEDIEKKMAEVYERIKSSVDEEGWTLFTRILDKNNTYETIYTLLSLLHLTQKKYVDMKQDELFGDIFIFVMKKNEKEVI